MRSRVIFSNRILKFIRLCAKTSREDKITVYAAQASFFMITSAIPLLSLLLALAGIMLPRSDIAERFFAQLPQTVQDLFRAPGVPILSLSAITTLWTASRGISAVRAGIENVYGSAVTEGFFKRRIRSVLSTLFFILFITAAAAVMLFGDLIVRFIPAPLARIFTEFRTPFFLVTMISVFTAVYISAARRSSSLPCGILRHLPGAVISSLGWVVFSMLYSLYLSHFPGASAVYGSLAAVCLIMLWMYFCMVILLFGAVFNKLRSEWGK